MKYQEVELSEANSVCPSCGSNRVSETYSAYVGNQGVLVEYVKCKDCTLIFQLKMIKDTEGYYKNYYRLLSNGDNDIPSNETLYSEWLRGLLVVEYLYRHIKRMDKYLDVGSSTGTLLSIMKDVYGCEVLGVEPNVGFGKYAKKEFGVNTVESIDKVKKKYDLVTMVHTLEHIKDPNKFLLDVKEKMDQEGVLYVQVPNRSRKEDAGINLSHPLAFDLTALKNVVERCGFLMYAEMVTADNICGLFMVKYGEAQ